MLEELISRVFVSRNAAHLEHWRTKSYEYHVTLEAFYNGVLTILDELVETYQGRFSLVQEVPPPKAAKTDIVRQLEADVVWLEENRDKIAQGIRALENILDTLSSHYLRTLYKLENLS